MELLCNDVIVLIANKLIDKDLLVYASLNTRFRQCVKSYFNEYIIVYTTSGFLPIAVIERKHPQFEQIIQHLNAQKGLRLSESFEYYRFLYRKTYSTVFYGIFDYCIAHRPKIRIYGKPFPSGHYKRDREERTIEKGVLRHTRLNKNPVEMLMIQNMKEVLSTIRQNNIVFYLLAIEGDKSVKNEYELLEQYSIDLRKRGIYHWGNNDDTYISARVITADTPRQNNGYVNIIMPGQWNSIVGEYNALEKSCKYAHCYNIHDNGGRPFKVFYNLGKTDILISKKEPYNFDSDDSDDSDDNDEKYSILVAEYTNIYRFLPGRENNGMYTGNSVLLNTFSNNYIYIGSCIYEFTTPENDTIQCYYSMIGNNDVPYPVAVGDNYVYFMLDNVYVPISVFPISFQQNMYSFYDGYLYFYANIARGKKETFPFLNFKIVCN